MILVSCLVVALIFVGIAFANQIGGDLSQRINLDFFENLSKREEKIGFKDKDKVKKSVEYYYLSKFAKIENGMSLSWNWSAALHFGHYTEKCT